MIVTETYKQATWSSLSEEARIRRALADNQTTTNTPNLRAPITHSSNNTCLPLGFSADVKGGALSHFYLYLACTQILVTYGEIYFHCRAKRILSENVAENPVCSTLSVSNVLNPWSHHRNRRPLPPAPTQQDES